MYIHYTPLTELLLPYLLGIVYFSIGNWILSQIRDVSQPELTIDTQQHLVEDTASLPIEQLLLKTDRTGNTRFPAATAPAKKTARSSKSTDNTSRTKKPTNTLADVLKKEYQKSSHPTDPAQEILNV